MARDINHQIVKTLLIQEGWVITHDPYILEDLNPDWEIDLGAEKMIAAEKELEKIAVEIKGFREASFAYEFHGAVGQYFNYRIGLETVEPERVLILAVPIEVYETHFLRQGVRLSVEKNQIKLLIYNSLTKTIEKWML
jgi:XisH protein